MPPDGVSFLLVDDREENLAALTALLRRDGLTLYTARSGQEALELLLVHDFALALLDVQMAGMDGFALAELMRGTARTRRVPIIFLTAVATDERRRFRGYEVGAVDYLLKPIEPRMLRNKTDVFFELARQRHELARQRDELRLVVARHGEALERLRAHRDNAPLAVVELDSEMRIVSWSRGAERLFGWSGAEMIGRRPDEPGWVYEADGDAFAALSGDLRAGRQPRGAHGIRCCCADGSIVECEWYSSALVDRAGRLVSVLVQILDVSDRRRAEETQQLLIGELNHRVKNTLATVQAIATQTLRHSGRPSEFERKFSGRIQALARAHSLLSSETWQGAGLQDLIGDQLRIGAIDETRLAARGPEVRLAPQAALHFALILHELVTNAAKYGALASPQGGIAVDWTIDGGLLRLEWREQGGPPVKAPARHGFGTALIEQSARAGGGAANALFRADGIVWEITLSVEAGALAPEGVAAARGADPGEGDAVEGGSAGALAGRRFLVVEDEPLLALELVSILEDAGAEVEGPAVTPQQALELIAGARLDGALLDGNLRGAPVDEVAGALTRAGVPFAFVTGYGLDHLPRAFAAAPVLTKPFTQQSLLETARRLLPASADVLRLRK